LVIVVCQALISALSTILPPLPHPNEDKKDGSKRAGVGVIYKISDISVNYKCDPI
jgi:hypothetical protein